MAPLRPISLIEKGNALSYSSMFLYAVAALNIDPSCGRISLSTADNPDNLTEKQNVPKPLPDRETIETR